MTGLILFNANVITMNPVSPQAQLVAIRNGKIQSVARNDSLKDLRNSKTKVIDCRGKTVLPGFIDTHVHLHGFAERLITLNLNPHNQVRSISEIQDRIREISKRLPLGSWIRGAGYSEFYLAEKRHPTRWDLDAVTPAHPIKLTHLSGRAHVLNSLALKLIHVGKETGDPEDGLIDRDLNTGEPTGLLFGMGDYLNKAIPPIEKDQMEQGIKQASHELCSSGITSIHDASPRNNLDRWVMFQRWKERGLLKSRCCVALGMEGFKEYQSHPFSTQVNENQLKLNGVKIVLHETTGQLSPGQEEDKTPTIKNAKHDFRFFKRFESCQASNGRKHQNENQIEYNRFVGVPPIACH
jgi:predicted amidohydrolase YtcJ